MILSRFIDRLTYESSPDWATKTNFEVRFYGVPFVVQSVMIDGQSIDFQLIDTVYFVKANATFNEISLIKKD